MIYKPRRFRDRHSFNNTSTASLDLPLPVSTSAGVWKPGRRLRFPVQHPEKESNYRRPATEMVFGMDAGAERHYRRGRWQASSNLCFGFSRSSSIDIFGTNIFK
ncbi:hypothetical protein PoB_007147400 [Plakobranchus ocellatus]|uniref:Uncharacterized protein n=1 Tax=Plakobranchus ocellatus TaxID=259542 RepID=A0AAV4DLQ0_9GAST|nr:hypothetical protein PoB_007147400 [Plakobranchus ocellatus]